ncbi:MAG TPA: MerR family transcriptional regulator [Solirubrobacteraceae bacterium]|jgi:DNA-binding transcriptional MerR regulator|nr:MerR family transcriptional regulator [Solirubrobacteraceae bacterium]
MAVSEQALQAPARLRIDELAQRSGIASGTIRFYQREGLIHPPQRDGRVAYYEPEHLRRLERIRALQGQHLPLALIRDLLEREDRGEDISGWLALDRAVFTSEGGETIGRGELATLGLREADVEALISAGVLWPGRGAKLEGQPGVLVLLARLVDAGVPPATIAAGARELTERLRAVAETIANLGWEVFAAERERIESDEPVAGEVLARFQHLRGLTERVVARMFPRLLDEAIRQRTEPYAVEVVKGKRRGRRQASR